MQGGAGLIKGRSHLAVVLLLARLADPLAQLVAGVALLVLARAHVREQHLLHLPRVGPGAGKERRR